MPLQLTRAEHDTAQRLIANLEASRRWKWHRWVNVSLAIAVFGVSAFGFWTLVQFEQVVAQDSLGFILGDRHEQVTAESVRLYTDLRVRSLFSQVLVLLGTTANALVGVQLLLTALLNWRRHLHDSLQAKLLRAALQREGVEVVDDGQRT